MSNMPKEQAQQAMENSVPAAVIYIRIAEAGPMVMGGTIDDVLNNREVITEDGSKLLVEAFHRAIEAILDTISNAPGVSKPEALADPKNVLGTIEVKQDLDFFDKVSVIDED